MRVLRLYKILEISEWLSFKKKKYFVGSKFDRSSGFIHMCKKEHLLTTSRLYYPKLRKLTVLEFRYHKIKDKIKWEISRNGLLFPHFYGIFPYKIINKVLIVDNKFSQKRIKIHNV